MINNIVKNLSIILFLTLISSNVSAQSPELDTILANSGFFDLGSTFEKEIYSYGETSMSLKVTDFTLTEFVNNSTSLKIERPDYSLVCQFSSPSEISLFLDNYIKFIGVVDLNINKYDKENKFYKTIRFEKFSILFQSEGEEAFIDYSNCQIPIDYSEINADLSDTGAFEFGYLYIKRASVQLTKATLVLQEWKRYLESNEIEADIDFESYENKYDESFEINFSPLIEEGLLVLDSDQSLPPNANLTAQIHRKFIHNLLTTDTDFDFIGMYGKPIKVEYIKSSDIINYIAEQAEKNSADVIKGIKVEKLDETFQGSDSLSVGYQVSFKLFQVTK